MKKLLILFSALALVLTLSACKPGGEDPDPDPDLVVTLAGLADQEITAGDVIDLLDGVTATGSDDVDYTSVINIDSDDCVVTDGAIDTSNPGTCHITYTAVVEGKMVRETITVTINPIDVGPVEGPIVAEWHWDTDDDLVGWTKYEAGGGSVTESIEDGALKLELLSGGLVYETRYEFMGLPFEDGQAYEISFKAKSSVDGKGIHFQVGELISNDPWFYDFKPGQVDDFKLSTEYQEFSFSFIYNKDLDSGFGGPLLEMGSFENVDEGISSVGIDCTVWLDDLVIKGGTGEDTIAPVINGADDKTIFIGDVASFDPLEGVTATDHPDVDLTADLILSGDTVDVNTVGVYYIYYVVLDDAYNQDRVARTITVMEDTEAPMVSGLTPVVLQVGGTFDALEGVMATDNRDGDVTANIVVEGDVVDVNVAGNYTVQYTIEDALGNSATYDRLVTVTAMIWLPTDLMPNGMFDANPWYVWAADWNTTSLTTDFSGGTAVLDIADFGTENWNIQLVQENLTFVENQTYRLTFNAMTTVDRDINVKVIAEDGTEYAEMVSITTTDTVYTVDFTFAQADSAGKISIELGGPNDGGIVVAVASVVTFDNLMLEQTDAIDGAVVVDTDQVENGDFAGDNLVGWTSWSRDWDPVITSSLEEVNGAGVFTYDSVGDSNWNNQFNFEGIPFVYGETYRVSFDAMSDVERDITVSIYDGATDWRSPLLTIGTEYATHEHVFTYTGQPLPKLSFELGYSGTDTTATVFYLDNVVIEVLEQDELVMNSQFDFFGWATWSADWLGLTSSAANVDGELVFTFNGGAGTESWNHQLNFDNLEFVPGTEYRLTFDAKSDVARDFLANIWDADNSLGHDSVAFTLGTDYASYEHIFTYDALADTSAKIEFKLGLVTAGDAGTMFYLDNVVLTEWDSANSLPVGDSIVPNGTFEEPVYWGTWFGDEWSGYTTSSAVVVDEVLEVTVAGLTDTHAAYATQVFQEGMTFRQGVTYTIMFDAYADVARQMNVQLGEPLAADPWFTEFMSPNTIDLTTEMQTFSITFTMGIDTNENGKLVFELGTIDGVAVDTVVYFDNIVIFENYNPQG